MNLRTFYEHENENCNNLNVSAKHIVIHITFIVDFLIEILHKNKIKTIRKHERHKIALIPTPYASSQRRPK